MIKVLKYLFSFKTDSIIYKPEIIKFLLGVILVGVGLTFTEMVFPNVLIIQILRGVFVISGLIVLFSFFNRLMCVSDNKEKYLIKNKQFKFKYKPIYVSVDDLEFLVKNATMPETMYVESATNDFYILQVTFDISGVRGEFYDKQFMIDDLVIDDEKTFFLKLLELEIIFNNNIKLYATFDQNEPEVLLKVIEDLRKNI